MCTHTHTHIEKGRENIKTQPLDVRNEPPMFAGLWTEGWKEYWDMAIVLALQALHVDVFPESPIPLN